MDDESKELLAFASKLARYSDNDVVILNTEPLREILNQARSDRRPSESVSIGTGKSSEFRTSDNCPRWRVSNS